MSAGVDLDPQLLERAGALTGERSNRAILELALRRYRARILHYDSDFDMISSVSEVRAEWVVEPGSAD